MNRTALTPVARELPAVVKPGRSGTPRTSYKKEARPGSVGSLPPISADGRAGATASDTTATTLADAFASLCSRCGEEYHLDGDDLGAACRAEVDAVHATLPGAEG